MYIAIGKRIKNMRIMRGLTQFMLAEKCDLSFSYIGHIERGTRVMSIDTLVKIANALDCSVDYLLGLNVPHEISLSQTLHMVADQLDEFERDKMLFCTKK